ncbi:AraC family transcriptional regulator [Paenibacillus doosanensis]|uniref:HTH-type transcriptional activator Btr n=1 Tax=Paenibacillus konkukensis TaxID=2020716 RepID=A0ABY4RPP3_9BACL|nr:MULTISPECIES: AraC family transcriptional regulator [Paenibacillus]MCS7459110.1 AraC family transcriptional regulator [Paenibacillus doosanensis]UQZ84165.1 HTH-type transcriptional activator Btr [Paenibacillus konkukensis]
MTLLDYRYTSDASAPSIELKLYYCGYERCAPGHSWGPALKDHYKILYIHGGKGIYRTGDRIYELGEGQGFLLCPDVIASYRADDEDPWTYSWVAFNGLSAELYLRRAQLSPANPVFRCTDARSMDQCFLQVYEASKSKGSSDTRLLSALYGFLSMLIEEAQSHCPSAKPDNLRDLYVQKAVEFIQMNYSQPVAIADMADWIGLERKYLSKLFKSGTGMSPQDFLIHFRVSKACELMKNPALSIGEIAGSVGYKDQLLFSKMFRKVKGMPPSVYRRTSTT